MKFARSFSIDYVIMTGYLVAGRLPGNQATLPFTGGGGLARDEIMAAVVRVRRVCMRMKKSWRRRAVVAPVPPAMSSSAYEGAKRESR